VKIAIIGEGLTEYHCVPTLAGRLDNIVVRRYQFGGSNAGIDWSLLFHKKIIKFVRIAALSAPDKILVVLDREDRDACPADLAAAGRQIILKECGYCLGDASISVVVSNREFESLLFCDYEAVDSLRILKGPLSPSFPSVSDEKDVVGWLHGGFKPGYNYDKLRDGKYLAQTMRLDDDAVLAHSRSARKLVKELRTQ
jgi:hypothetical protein